LTLLDVGWTRCGATTAILALREGIATAERLPKGHNMWPIGEAP
jgi:hypothetical protein